MKIMIVGTGYVGLTTGIGMAELGHEIICYDTNSEKINQLNRHQLPIFETNMDKLLIKNKKSIIFTDNIFPFIGEVSVLFLTIGTPSEENGDVNMNDLFQAVDYIGESLNHSILIINKCTVPPGTTDRIKERLDKILISRKLTFKCRVIFNPEFLHEGNALTDFFQPDRIIIGSDNCNEIPELAELFLFYTTNHIPILYTNIRTAELLKYVNNAVAALKVSFINEIANICEYENVNVWELIKLLTYDKRVSPQYLSPGIGFGGSCLPKDIKALECMAKKVHVHLKMINKIIEVNYFQIKRTASIIQTHFPRGQITVLGTAFKANTNDIRESPSIQVINELIKTENYMIHLYDPQALENTRKELQANSKKLSFFTNLYDACIGSGAIAILTNWPQFSGVDLIKIKEIAEHPFIFDFHNVLGEDCLIESGLRYYIRGITGKEDIIYD